MLVIGQAADDIIANCEGESCSKEISVSNPAELTVVSQNNRNSVELGEITTELGIENANLENSNVQNSSENDSKDSIENLEQNDNQENASEVIEEESNGNNITEETSRSESETTENLGSSNEYPGHTTEENSEPTTQPYEKGFKCTAVGRFADPNDCQKYNYCWDLVHQHILFSCKGKEVFDPELGHCTDDWSKCSETPKCVADKQILGDSNDKHGFFICKNRGTVLAPIYSITKKLCDKHLVFDGELLVCVPDENSLEDIIEEERKKFECSANGIFPDLADEKKYYECILKDPIKGKFKTKKHSCPKDHVFNLQDLTCIPENGIGAPVPILV